MIENLKQEIFKSINDNKDKAINLNDYLADNPELSTKEYLASKKIVEMLREEGYKVEFPFCNLETAFKAQYGDGSKLRNVAIMVEYDALPEIGHACGHCTSAAISILAGLSLKELEEELDANIQIIGTPNEEAGGYKLDLIKAGAFDKCDMAIMIHLYGENLISPNAYAIKGATYAFKGVPAHAASSPWEGKNALNGVQLMFHAIDMLRQHVKPDVKIHGVVRDGGLAPNIVPENASAEFFFRSMDKDYLDLMMEKIDDCAKGAAIATQTTYEKHNGDIMFYNLKKNKTGEEVLAETFEELGLEEGDTSRPFGSTDAGNVSFVCPTFHPTIQISKSNPQIHTREFESLVKSKEAHEAIVVGAKVLALQILKVFTSDEIFKSMQEDFKK